VDHALPELDTARGGRFWKAWCAGCSSGEEPYTLAMLLADYRNQRPNTDFAVLATDISTRVLEKARLGIYDAERVAPLPVRLRSNFVRRSRDPACRSVRIAPELRGRVAFHRLNFMDPDYRIKDMFDFVFFRNVAIYFDAETHESVVSKLCRQLVTGGYLFIGQSESLSGMSLPLEHVGPAIYRRTGGHS
jgi:chemotaxis protein methyltransferase CheR